MKNQDEKLKESFLVKTKKTLRTTYMQVFVMFSTLFISNAALADFQEFQDSITDFAHGPFGIGISVLAIILGAVFGLAKMTAWPALTGLAVAAMLAIGPYMVVQVFAMFSSL